MATKSPVQSRVRLRRFRSPSGLLENLLDLALTHAHGAEVEVEARSHAAGQVLISVRDDGLGVPEEDRERTFDKYQ